jgi:uncharacterized OB-fold protein
VSDAIDAMPKPRPQPTPVSQPFWDALRDERVELQRCADCGRWVYYPRSRCPACLSDRLRWTVVDGSGTVYTFTVGEQATAPPFADGVRMSTTLVDVDPVDIAIGMPVAPVFDHGDDGITLLRFRPRR